MEREEYNDKSSNQHYYRIVYTKPLKLGLERSIFIYKLSGLEHEKKTTQLPTTANKTGRCVFNLWQVNFLKNEKESLV